MTSLLEETAALPTTINLLAKAVIYNKKKAIALHNRLQVTLWKSINKETSFTIV